ncbi:MAG: phosphoribulokinase [Betaproteobacteria bacterium RBG_16_58_11]|nr:MAG: phosphoribulokinase [Betaproteobacteria bacterium RBG_16_58_11]
MSQHHPIVAVTGSAGAGTTTVRHAFSDIFRRQGIQAQLVKGNSFYRFEQAEMNRLIAQPTQAGRPISYFGPEANHFDKLESLFAQYAKNASGAIRQYVKDEADAKQFGQPIGTFTPWQKIEKGSDLLFYEGMHGGVAAHTWTRRKANPAHLPQSKERRGNGGKGINAAQHVDLLIGVVPAVNLEWIQKIHRDCSRDGCTEDESTATILRRMRDYTYFIAPQFALTDINFQRMPLVDTSHPFIARDIPTADESIVVIHFRDPHKFDFPSLLQRISGSFMSRPNTLVVPGGKMRLALDVACTPLIEEMMEKKSKKARA